MFLQLKESVKLRASGYSNREKQETRLVDNLKSTSAMASNGIVYCLMKKLNNIFYTQQVHCHTKSQNTLKCFKWDITLLDTLKSKPQVKYGILILNRPLMQDQVFMSNFWNNATIRITVDGGTVQWDRYMSKLSEEVQKTLELPTLITGDFDSITPEIMEKYKQKGCKAVHTPDQDYTDFTKALMEHNKYCLKNEIEMDSVIAVGQSSGRIDQILGNIQTLFLNKDHQILQPNTKLYIMSDDALSWLLGPGDHEIIIPEETRNHKRAWCSLVPIGESCDSVTSTGLKWNLDNQPLKFGELVSTSNTFDGSERVTIKCSHTLLWSMRIPSLVSS